MDNLLLTLRVYGPVDGLTPDSFLRIFVHRANVVSRMLEAGEGSKFMLPDGNDLVPVPTFILFGAPQQIGHDPNAAVLEPELQRDVSIAIEAPHDIT